MDREELDKLAEVILNLDDPRDFDKYMPHMSAYEFVRDCNKDRMGLNAINYFGRIYTFDEFFSKIDDIAKGFVELGVKPKDRVGMSMLATPEAIMTIYALNKVGAHIYMICGTHDKVLIEDEIKNSDAKLLIINSILYNQDISKFCDEAGVEKVISVGLDESTPVGFYADAAKFKYIKMLATIKGSCYKDDKVITWKDFYDISRFSNKVVVPFYEKGAPAISATTSGTNGKPKRPVHSCDSFNAMPIQMGMSYKEIEPGDAIFTTLPTWIDYCTENCINEAIVHGACVCLDPIFNPDHVSKRFRQYDFNHWNTIPAYLEGMVKDKGMKNMDLSRMKTITTGGDFRTPKLKERAEEVLRRNNCFIEVGQGYGYTQGLGAVASTYMKGVPANSVGKPVVGNWVKIVDIDSKEEKVLGLNECGILYTYSPCQMLYYDKDEEATKEAFVVDERGIPWYNTEDAATIDENGMLYIYDRIGKMHMVSDDKGQPAKIFPGKVKQIISMYPGIIECEVIVIPDQKRISAPVAYVVLGEGIEYSGKLPSKINDFCCQNKLESYSLPIDYVFVDKIPKTPALKVDYNELLRDYENRNNDQAIRKRK